MIKKWITVLLLLPVFAGGVRAEDSYYATNYLFSAPAAGSPGSTAIHASSNAFSAWADGYIDVVYGAAVGDEWKTPDLALGPVGGSESNVVVLGRGGRITLTFSGGIGDRPGADFAVFENGYNAYFLELAHVEVSSDGIHFVRFPNYSDTPGPVAAFGVMFTEYIHGVASKYEKHYGTPFDLAELRTAYNAQLAGNTDFSPAFATGLTNNYPMLDLDNITHVRLVDIVGDGTALDARGSIIYDPYPTAVSAGFDLSGIGVIHPGGAPDAQHIFFEPLSDQIEGTGPLQVNAYASSGLPVSLEVVSGPAFISGNQLTVSNMTGTVQLRAAQSGNGTTAPAEDVFMLFEVVEAGASNAPLTLAQWAAASAVPTNGLADSDGDGVIDFQEFIMGGNPKLPADAPRPVIKSGMDASGHPVTTLEYRIARKALGRSRVSGSAELGSWSNMVPEIIDMSRDTNDLHMTIRLQGDAPHGFYRLIFEEQ